MTVKVGGTTVSTPLPTASAWAFPIMNIVTIYRPYNHCPVGLSRVGFPSYVRASMSYEHCVWAAVLICSPEAIPEEDICYRAAHHYSCSWYGFSKLLSYSLRFGGHRLLEYTRQPTTACISIGWIYMRNYYYHAPIYRLRAGERDSNNMQLSCFHLWKCVKWTIQLLAFDVGKPFGNAVNPNDRFVTITVFDQSTIDRCKVILIRWRHLCFTTCSDCVRRPSFQYNGRNTVHIQRLGRVLALASGKRSNLRRKGLILAARTISAAV